MQMTPRALTAAACLLASVGANAAEMYLSPSGNDTHPGTAAEPFATLERARDAVRELRQQQPNRTTPVVVQLRGGTYWLSGTFRLEPADSGTPDSPTVYEAAPGEMPILSAGRALTGWRQERPGVWQVALPEVAAGQWRFGQLYVGDQRRPRPMLPKSGYYFVGGPSGNASSEFVYRPGEIDPNWRNLTDIEMWSAHSWTDARLPLKSVDAAKRVCYLAGSTWHPDLAALKEGVWYRLENVAEALDEPGEWYLDRPTGTLTYLAKPGETPADTPVVAPRWDQVVQIDGNTDRGEFVDHLSFRGLTFAHANWASPSGGKSYNQAECGLGGAIQVINGRHVTFEGCVVRHTGNSGIVMEAGCSDCRIERCELVDLGGCGVRIGTARFDDEPDARKHCFGNLVRDCLVAHIGRVHPAAVGLLVTHARENVLEHNEVADTYYSAISVGWRWSGGPSPAHHNRIEYNTLHDLGQGVLSDLAGIYTLGESPGTVERFNRIHTVRRARYGGWGIYFDESSADIVVENNLAYDTEDAPFHLHYGQRLTLRHNIFAFGQNDQIKLSNLAKAGTMQVEGNVWYYTQGELFNGAPDEEISFSRNLYWHEGGTVTFPGGKTLEQWQQIEPDCRVADPTFVDPARGDFRPQTGGPAAEMGLRPADLSQAGRLTKTNLTAGLPPVPRTFDPAPPEPPLQLSENFDGLQTDRSWPGWTQMAASVEENVRVTDVAAASGMHSLQFNDGPGGAVYFPHLFREVQYLSGKVRISFDLRATAGSDWEFACRDNTPWFTDGPNVRVKPGGQLESGGQPVATLPLDAWVHLELTCAVGPDRTGEYTLAVTLPDGRAQATTIRLKEQFGELGWIGFAGLSTERVKTYLDNFELHPEQ
jgi:hypothetical protein